jgi:hypothetical protein
VGRGQKREKGLEWAADWEKEKEGWAGDAVSHAEVKWNGPREEKGKKRKRGAGLAEDFGPRKSWRKKILSHFQNIL